MTGIEPRSVDVAGVDGVVVDVVPAAVVEDKGVLGSEVEATNVLCGCAVEEAVVDGAGVVLDTVEAEVAEKMPVVAESAAVVDGKSVPAAEVEGWDALCRVVVEDQAVAEEVGVVSVFVEALVVVEFAAVV